MADPVKVEVTGLSQAGANFAKLGSAVQHEIGRQSLRDGTWALVNKMRAATYTTGFVKRSGYVQSGLSVAVANDPKNGGQLTAWAVEYPQSIAGSTPAAALFRKHMSLKGHRPSAKQGGGGSRVELSGVAFYWRFLEFGTGPRKSAATPRFLRTGLLARNDKLRARQRLKAKAWLALPSRGGMTAKPWLRPTFGSTAPDAINSFSETIGKLIDKAVTAMPKK
jgi:HK97 gp10 family phage protein